MEAARYAETLRQEAEAKAGQERMAWEAALDAKQRELEQYDKKIQKMRALFEEMLGNMDMEAENFSGQVRELRSQSPSRNMGLFQMKDA